MSVSAQAFISIDQVCNSYRLRTNRTIHSYCKIVKFAADGVRELALSHMPMVKHVILTKETTESWFVLPTDYVDYVSMGIRCGNYWRPIPVQTQLMPFPNSAGGGEYSASQFTPEFNTQGNWTNWINPVLQTTAASFAGDDFFYQDYQTQPYQATPPVANCGCGTDYAWAYPFGYGGYNNGGGWYNFWSDKYDTYGEATGRYFGGGDGVRNDVAIVNPMKGIVMAPQCFPSNSLYLVYIGYGTVDTMTYIPIQAQAAIEAYIDWQWASTKKNVSRGEAADWERKFYGQVTIMRRRFNQITATDIHRIIAKHYGVTQKIK